MSSKTLRYAIIGIQEHFINYVLDTFRHQEYEFEVVALVDDTISFANKIAKKYKVPDCFETSELENKIKELKINVFYITDGSMLDDEMIYLIEKYKIHFICESPLYLSFKKLSQLVQICQQNNIKSMIAYHFIFDDPLIRIYDILSKKSLGNIKFINSTFNYAIKNDNDKRIRNYGGKTSFYKLAIMCIQLARFILRDNPITVGAFTSASDNPKYINIEDTTTVSMKFSNDQLASFTISFGNFESSDLEIIGEKGRIRLENAYSYTSKSTLKVDYKVKNALLNETRNYGPRKDFFSEIYTFNFNILKNRPLPLNSILDGHKNLVILEAIVEAIMQKKQVIIQRDGTIKTIDNVQAKPSPKIQRPLVRIDRKDIKLKDS